MNKKTKNWIFALVALTVIVLAVVSANSKLFLGALPGLPGGFITPPAPRICSSGEFSVAESPSSPRGPIDIDQKQTVLGKFIVSTRNCTLPMNFVSSEWDQSSVAEYWQIQYYVSLSNAAVYPSLHDQERDYGYFVSSGVPNCIRAERRLNAPTQGFSLTSPGNITIIPPNNSTEFVVRGDLTTNRNSYFDKNARFYEPRYSLGMVTGISRAADWRGSTLGYRGFVQGGRPVNPATVGNTCL